MTPSLPNGNYLFDTNVISATRRGKEEPKVLRLIASVPLENQFVSVLTLGELWRGFNLKHRQNPHGAKALSHWIETVEEGFIGRILPLDHEMVRIWGDLATDRSRPILDTLLAATAIARNMTLVTRNVSDFQGLPVRLLNPWA